MWKLICAAAVLSQASLGDAWGADQFIANYTAYWAGLPAAEIRLTRSADAAVYRDAIEIRSEGLPHLITHFRADAEAGGRLAPGRIAQPLHYDARYDVRKWRNSRIAMRFVQRGGTIVAERGAEDSSKKVLLDEQYRRGVVDPLSAFESVRAQIAARDAAPDSRFMVPVYDGTRRFDVIGRVLPKPEQTPGTLRIALDLRPIAGFKGQSKIDGDPDDAPRPVTVTLTDDQRLLPISMTLRVFYLPLVIQLDRVCSAAERCRG